MQVKVAIQKITRFGKSDGGDTIEVVERPRGGISIILADSQGSGPGAKRTSAMVVNKAMSLIGDGTRDGAVARAVHDYLCTLRHGKVSSTLSIVSIDLVSNTLVISRNSNTPVLVFGWGSEHNTLGNDVPPIGVTHMNRPDINQFGLKVGMKVTVFSDGFYKAGGDVQKMSDLIISLLTENNQPLEEMAENLFNQALAKENFRPRDDMTLSLIALEPRLQDLRVKKYNLSFPL